MDRDALISSLLATLDDGRLSRSERRAASASVAESAPSDAERRALASSLVAAIRDRMTDPREQDAIEWLWDVLGLLWQPPAPGASGSRAYFGPEDPMVETLQGLIGSAHRTLEIAVFTITDDRLVDVLLAAHRRGVAIRILTDDDKQWDLGSDVRRLADAGISVALDRSPHHFHHKFALIDSETLVTGSYNWTRGADQDNRENFLVTRDPDLVRSFGKAFERLWRELAE